MTTRPKLLRTFRGVCELCGTVKPACVNGTMLVRIDGTPGPITLCVKCVHGMPGFTPDAKHRRGDGCTGTTAG